MLAGDVQLAVINLTSQLPSSSEPLDSSSYNVRYFLLILLSFHVIFFYKVLRVC